MKTHLVTHALLIALFTSPLPCMAGGITEKSSCGKRKECEPAHGSSTGMDTTFGGWSLLSIDTQPRYAGWVDGYYSIGRSEYVNYPYQRWTTAETRINNQGLTEYRSVTTYKWYHFPGDRNPEEIASPDLGGGRIWYDEAYRECYRMQNSAVPSDWGGSSTTNNAPQTETIGKADVEYPSFEDVQPSASCSTCGDNAGPLDTAIFIRLTDQANSVFGLVFEPDVRLADFFTDAAFSSFTLNDSFPGVAKTGTLDSGSVTVTSLATGAPLVAATITAVRSSRLESVTMVVTPSASIGEPPSTHFFERITSGAFSGVRYTRTEAGSSPETIDILNLISAGDSMIKIVKHTGEAQTFTEDAETAGDYQWVPDASQTNGGHFAGITVQQVLTTSAGGVATTITRQYGRIGDPLRHLKVLLAETRQSGGHETTTLHGYDERLRLSATQTNELFGERIWSASSDGGWQLSLAQEISLLSADIYFAEQIEFTPFKDGPPAPVRPASFATATPQGLQDTRAYFEALIDQARTGAPYYSLPGTRRRVISDKSVQENLPGRWRRKIESSIGGTLHGIEYEYETQGEAESPASKVSLSDSSPTRRFGLRLMFGLHSMTEKWTPMAAQGWTAPGAMSTWSARYTSGTDYDLTVDQTRVARVKTSIFSSDQFAGKECTFLIHPSSGYSLVDGHVIYSWNPSEVVPVWSRSSADSQGRATQQLNLFSPNQSGSAITVQQIDTSRSGDTAYIRSAGGQTLDSQGEDTIATENNIRVRTSTSTDRQGLTTVTKTNEATGELISETKQGVEMTADFPAQPDVTTAYAKNINATTGEVTQTVTQTAAGTSHTLSTTVIDAWGRTKSVVDEIGRETSYDYSADGRTTTETLPGGLTRITTTYLDGQLKSITGTAAIAEFHDYQVNSGADGAQEAGTITEIIWTGWDGTGAPPPQAVRRAVTTNYLGWVLNEEEAGPQGAVIRTTHTYNSKGQRTQTERAGEVPQFFEYDSWGNLSRTGRVGGAEVTEYATTYETVNDAVVAQTRETQHTRADGTQPRVTLHQRSLLEGSTWQKTILPDGSSTQVSDATNGASRLRQEFVHDTTGTTPVLLSKRTYYNGLLMREQPAGAGEETTFGYSAFGQITSRVDPARGTSSWDYDPVTGQLLSETPSGSSTATFYTYYPANQASAGLLRTRTSGSQVARYAYDQRGGIAYQWGSAGPPIAYRYDTTGKLESMITHREGQGWASAELPPAFTHASSSSKASQTTWSYWPGTHLLFQKTSAEGIGQNLTYEYEPGTGRVATRHGGVSGTHHSYDERGRVRQLLYDHEETPDITYTYTPDGRLETVADAAGEHHFHYQRATASTPEVETEIISGSGHLSGIAIIRESASDGRPLTLRVCYVEPDGSGGYTITRTISETQQEWDAARRLHRAYGGSQGTGAGGPGYAYEWAYDPATGRLASVDSTAFPTAEVPNTLHRHYGYTPAGRVETLHYNARLAGTAGLGSSLLGYFYHHDSLGRRERVEPWLPDGPPPLTDQPAGWTYAYNDRGEIETARRFTAQGGAVNGISPHETRTYKTDLMGNRTRLELGEDGNPISTAYWNMPSDQIGTIFTDRRFEITGMVRPGSTLTINGEQVDTSLPGNQTADPHSFRKVLTVPDDGGWLRTLEATAAAPGEPPTLREGFIYVAPQESNLGYDGAGNLVTSPRWLYSWDGAGRLLEANELAHPVEMRPGFPHVVPLRKLRFAYDHMGRRVAKTVWRERLANDPNGPGWDIEKDLRFVYDGWNMIAELDHTFAPPGQPGFSGVNAVQAARSIIRTYLWGPDLSGTMTGAGGVGGLLSFTNHRDGQELTQSSTFTYHVCSDANGNVTGLVPANGPDAGKLIARYDYDPFGNRITNTGPDVELCPFGFSSKYMDSETGVVYYGYRYYSPELGKWLSRDPIGERGGVNLYGMVKNDPVNRWDYLGLEGCKIEVRCGPVMGGMYHCGIYVNGTEFGIGGGPKQFHGNPALFTPTGVPPEYANDAPAKAPEGIRTYPGTCKCPCDAVKRCMKDHQANTAPPEYAALSGPNSNTYAHRLLHHCECSVDPIHIPERWIPVGTGGVTRLPPHDTTTPPDSPNWNHPDFDNYPPTPSP